MEILFFLTLKFGLMVKGYVLNLEVLGLSFCHLYFYFNALVYDTHMSFSYL